MAKKPLFNLTAGKTRLYTKAKGIGTYMKTQSGKIGIYYNKAMFYFPERLMGTEFLHVATNEEMEEAGLLLKVKPEEKPAEAVSEKPAEQPAETVSETAAAQPVEEQPSTQPVEEQPAVSEEPVVSSEPADHPAAEAQPADLPAEPAAPEAPAVVVADAEFEAKRQATLQQFNAASVQVNGWNVIDAPKFAGDDLLFNERYTLFGDDSKAKTITAVYDLTIIGDVKGVESIKVEGNLFINGDLNCEALSCRGNVMCTGSIWATKIYVGGNLTALNVNAYELTCDGTLVVTETLDTNGKVQTGNILAGEGISGMGEFHTGHAIAGDYCDFSDELDGEVYELSSETLFGAKGKPVEETVIPAPVAQPAEKPLDQAFSEVAARFAAMDLAGMKKLDRKALLAAINKISPFMVPDFGTVTDRLNKIATLKLGKIGSLNDYLYCKTAEVTFPQYLKESETYQNIVTKAIPEAEKAMTFLLYVPEDINELARSLDMVNICKGKLVFSADWFYDKIFNSVGVRYKTVKMFMHNH